MKKNQDIVSALDAVMRMASGMRMHVVTTTSFGEAGLSVEAYLPGDKRRGMSSHSWWNFELAAAKLLKQYRPEIYEGIKDNLRLRA